VSETSPGTSPGTSPRTGPDEVPGARLREVERAILGRTPEHDIVPSLDRIREVLDLLGDPQQSAPVVQVAGTNGKTSTTRMV
jgi:dihydrofolate synthase / folylpolyglutamate synthase